MVRARGGEGGLPVGEGGEVEQRGQGGERDGLGDGEGIGDGGRRGEGGGGMDRRLPGGRESDEWGRGGRLLVGGGEGGDGAAGEHGGQTAVPMGTDDGDTRGRPRPRGMTGRGHTSSGRSTRATANAPLLDGGAAGAAATERGCGVLARGSTEGAARPPRPLFPHRQLRPPVAGGRCGVSRRARHAGCVCLPRSSSLFKFQSLCAPALPVGGRDSVRSIDST